MALFIEHMGRAIYEGIYEPGHPAADEQGFPHGCDSRWYAMLGVPIVRYPGGNFVSGFQLGGFRGQPNRPQRLDLAWFTTEPNAGGSCTNSATGAKKADSRAHVLP